MTRYGETEADDIFRLQAAKDGYLDTDGRGLWAWYRDNGLIPPEKLRDGSMKTGVTLGEERQTPRPAGNLAADLTGSPITLNGRSTRPSHDD